MVTTQQICRVCRGLAPSEPRCTNGCCARCHQEYCTPGGATSPGHGLAVYAVLSPTGEPVFVQAGTIGNYAVRSPQLWQGRRDTQTAAETAAALAGSMFGWHCAGARRENYNEDGTPVKTKRVQA